MRKTAVRITNVRFAAATPGEVEAGLLGWVACRLNDSLQLDGIAVRRTIRGELRLSFPARRDNAGRQRFYIRPLDDTARRDLEAQVFRAIGLEGAVR